MATFADVGKDVTDQFTKDLAKEQNVELSAKVNNYFSFLLKGNVKAGGVVDGTFAPTIKVPDYNVDIKPELTTKDKNEKTFKLEIVANDAFTKGLKFELGTSNGKKGELYLGTAYKNAKFGGVTGRITFPEGKDKFLTPSVYLETPETKGFGIGANAKVVLGDNASVESWKALLAYKKDDFSGFAGISKQLDEVKADPKAPKAADSNVEPKAKPAPKPGVVTIDGKDFTTGLHVVGGLLKKFDTNKSFGINGDYNTCEGALNLEFLFRKNYEDGTFLKVKGDLEGNVAVSKQFKVSGASVVLGTNVDVFSGKGNAGFQFSTDL